MNELFTSLATIESVCISLGNIKAMLAIFAADTTSSQEELQDALWEVANSVHRRKEELEKAFSQLWKLQTATEEKKPARCTSRQTEDAA